MIFSWCIIILLICNLKSLIYILSLKCLFSNICCMSWLLLKCMMGFSLVWLLPAYLTYQQILWMSWFIQWFNLLKVDMMAVTNVVELQWVVAIKNRAILLPQEHHHHQQQSQLKLHTLLKLWTTFPKQLATSIQNVLPRKIKMVWISLLDLKKFDS